MLALVTPVGADSDTVLRALFRVKAYARTTGVDLQSIDEEEPDVASMLMTASLASLLEDPILYEALRGFERPSDLDGVRNVAIELHSKSQSRKRATPSGWPSRDWGGDPVAGRRAAVAPLDSDDEDVEGPGGGARGRKLAPLKESQLRRSISREVALSVRGDEVTEAAQRAADAATPFSAAIVPSSHLQFTMALT